VELSAALFCLAAGLLYYFFVHRPMTAKEEKPKA